VFIAQIISIIGYLGLFDKWGIMPEQIETIIANLLQLMVLFGILNNPTNPQSL
jgi:uncharacterized membrane protein